MIPDFSVEPIIGLAPDLPAGYLGYFGRLVSPYWGYAETSLDVFVMNTQGKTVFVRTFRGDTIEACQRECDDWIMGLYETALIG